MLCNEKFIVGIIIAIVGGTLFVTSFVFGVLHLLNGSYLDMYSFPVRLSAIEENPGIGEFTVKNKNELSFWLKVPDRRIENQNITLTVEISDHSDKTITSFCGIFKGKDFRNGLSFGQYYYIGKYLFDKNFKGKIKYTNAGQWIAPYNGMRVIIIAKPYSPPPLNFALSSIIGLFVFLKGTRTINKYKDKINT